jgi:tRNA threonylcarbamoyladenosine biosynthesis protein TsaB
MKILAIETSAQFCSAALLVDKTLIARHEQAPRRHGERLLPMLEDLLAEGGLTLTALDAIAFGRGPGSFTGVRIAAAVAQGVAFGADLPLLGVSTLAGLAHRAWQRQGGEHILTAIDARIGEVYWGLFQCNDQGEVMPLEPERVSPPEQVRCSAPWPVLGAGHAWSLYQTVLMQNTGIGREQIDAAAICTAADIAQLASHALGAAAAPAPEDGLPIYLRDQVAVKPAQPAG